MNLFDLLANYKTTPEEEINKIYQIIYRHIFGTKTLWDYLSEVFYRSKFASFQPDIDSFISAFVFRNEIFEQKNEEEIELLKYRLFVEFLSNLFLVCLKSDLYYKDAKDSIWQIKSIIKEGLQHFGFELIENNYNYVTAKKDLTAEIIATCNKDYKDDIYDFLIAKSVSEKENALTNLSIKLQAVKPLDSFSRRVREYIQLLRHKTEKKEDPNYSWFFEKADYDKNLDGLFKILICFISHQDCYQTLTDFDKNSHKES